MVQTKINVPVAIQQTLIEQIIMHPQATVLVFLEQKIKAQLYAKLI